MLLAVGGKLAMASYTTLQDNRWTPPKLDAPGQGMLVAIDPHVPAAAELAAGILPGATLLWLGAIASPEATLGDRLAPIATLLETHPGYRSLHLITHGSPGQLYFGNQVLSRETLHDCAPLLQRWRAALPEGFELVLYGCEVARGDRGRQFLQQLHNLTGAQIAASATPTGNAALGGDWPLGGPLALTAAARDRYPGLLAISTVPDLIAAINTANANGPGLDTIALDPTTFNFSSAGDNDPFFGASALPAITTQIVINGNGATFQRAASAPGFRFFLVGGFGTEPKDANLTLNNVTLTGGFANGVGDSSDDGGAILVSGGKLTLNNSTVTGNTANDDGGGILAVGTSTPAPGYQAEVTLDNTVISNNIAIGASLGDGGGGIDIDANKDEGGRGAVLTVRNNSRIENNSTTNGSGGGLRVRDGAELTLDNSSVTGNSAKFGGGIAEVTHEAATANKLTFQNNPTITGNDNSGGLDLESPRFITPNTEPPNNDTNPTINGTATIGFTNVLALRPAGAAPRVVRLNSSGQFLATIDDEGTLNLGAIALNSAFTSQFRIENWGQTDLTVEPTSSDTQFATVAPTGAIALNDADPSEVFTLTLNTTAEGTFATTIQFDSGNPGNPFNFEVQATVTATPIVTPPSLTNNIFVVGQTGNLKVQVESAPTDKIVDVRASKLNSSDQVVEIINLFSVLPDGFRPNGFSTAPQQQIFGTVEAGDRLGFQLTTIDGRTINYTSDQLQIRDRGNGIFSFGFEIDGNGLFDDVVLTIQQTTETPPLGTGDNQSQGLEVLDLLGSGGARASFTVYREAAFDNFVGFYRIDDVSGSVGGLAPGASGYAQAAIEQRISGIELAVANRSVSQFSADLGGNALYAPFIIVKGDPFSFSTDNPDNLAGVDQQAYFIFTAANPDGVDHVRLLGDNVFGFEDLPGGGDFDFNDIIVQVSLG